MTTRSFQTIPAQQLARRVALPFFMLLMLGFIMTGTLFKRWGADTNVSQFSVPFEGLRDPASVPSTFSHTEPTGSATELYLRVLHDWTHIPAVCKDDFPLTSFQKSQCDLLWKNVLSRAFLASMPFVLILALFHFWSRSIVRTYNRASSRIQRRKVAMVAQVEGDAPHSLYSWSHGFSPAWVVSQEIRVVAHFEQPPTLGETVHLYEAGRWMGKNQLVGIENPKSKSSQAA